jgi:hypothetical protein
MVTDDCAMVAPEAANTAKATRLFFIKTPKLKQTAAGTKPFAAPHR